MARTPCYFHPEQLAFKPLYEWAFGEKIDHPETTARAESILRALRGHGQAFEVIEPRQQPLAAIRDAHSNNLLTLYHTASRMPPGETLYPSVFPREFIRRGDPTNLRHAGCFCFDSGTPLNAMTMEAAAWSAACAHEGARRLKRGSDRLVYALSRPPGHHATREFFGGYSYFNNTVIAARYLRRHGRVAVLDIDFHHGNGTQTSFWRDDRVLTLSLHGDPKEYFPFYVGFPHETGQGRGEGYNLNFCFPGGTDFDAWMAVLLEEALPAVERFGPDWLVVAAGFDTYHLDPIGAFTFRTGDYAVLGERIGRLGLPTLVVQEGGYHSADLGANAVSLLSGMREHLGP